MLCQYVWRYAAGCQAGGVTRSGAAGMMAARWVRRRPLTLTFVAGLAVAEVVEVLLPGIRFHALQAWASTNVARLTSEPFGPLVVSVFVVDEYRVLWVVLAAMAFALVEPRLGWVRTLVIAVAAQLAGTVASEGIVWWRVQHGRLPSAALHQFDIGVSYIVVAVLTAAVVLAPRWPGRICAAVALAVIAPDLLAGLTRLQVSGVGHFVAILSGVISGVAVVAVHHHRQRLRAWPNDEHAMVSR